MEFHPRKLRDGSSSPGVLSADSRSLDERPQGSVITGFVATQRVSRIMEYLVLSSTYKLQWGEEHFIELGIQVQLLDESDESRGA